jgi:hypothetical protein
MSGYSRSHRVLLLMLLAMCMSQVPSCSVCRFRHILAMMR